MKMRGLMRGMLPDRCRRESHVSVLGRLGSDALSRHSVLEVAWKPNDNDPFLFVVPKDAAHATFRGW